MYVLNGPPTGGEVLNAYTALDEVYGTQDFEGSAAVDALQSILQIDAGKAQSLLNSLVTSGYASEV